jgi:hypothetical protein
MQEVDDEAKAKKSTIEPTPPTHQGFAKKSTIEQSSEVGRTCYHPSNHRVHATAKANAAKAKRRKQRPEDARVNKLGEQWAADFKRRARANGVSDERLREIDSTHLKHGAQEQLMHALKVLMVGTAEECVDVATELAEQQDIDANIFAAMADYAATNSHEFDSVTMTTARGMDAVHKELWKNDPNWAPADNIDEQLARTDGEGAETYLYAKGEVDHLRDTGGVRTCHRQSAEVQRDLAGTRPLDCKWVIVRKLKKCKTSGKMVYSRLRLRLTLRGFRQRAGVQFDPHGTFAPWITHATVSNSSIIQTTHTTCRRQQNILRGRNGLQDLHGATEAILQHAGIRTTWPD